VLRRVEKWLDTLENATAWTSDVGTAVGELRLTGVSNGPARGDPKYLYLYDVSVSCVEHLADEVIQDWGGEE
jgi:hypothetical protein